MKRDKTKGIFATVKVAYEIFKFAYNAIFLFELGSFEH